MNEPANIKGTVQLDSGPAQAFELTEAETIAWFEPSERYAKSIALRILSIQAIGSVPRFG